MYKIGQRVRQEFGSQIMEVIDFESELIENVITQWENKEGTIITGKFMDSQLVQVEQE